MDSTKVTVTKAPSTYRSGGNHQHGQVCHIRGRVVGTLTGGRSLKWMCETARNMLKRSVSPCHAIGQQVTGMGQVLK
jgi:hypothetical protein